MNFSLIVPLAADKPEYALCMPNIFSSTDSGVAVCVRSILGLNLESFDHIYFTVLKKHVVSFSVDKILDEQLASVGLSKVVDIVCLDMPTSSQPETVYETIERIGINGPFMVKDGDSSFSAIIRPENEICIYPLDVLSLVNPQHKSYVAIDDSFYVTNIIENRIVSRFFSAGGYVFSSTELFKCYYLPLKHFRNLYISHIIYYMLLHNNRFRAIECTDYIDWSTDKDYHR